MEKSANTEKKFQFFEEVKEPQEPTSNRNSINTDPDSKDKNNIQNLLEKELDVSNLTLEKADQMQAYNGMLFISAKITYEATKTKDHKIFKIIGNKIIDQLSFFKQYFDFQIINFLGKPFLISLGISFQRYSLKGREEIHQISSIKFYNLLPIIEKGTEKYKTKEGLTELEEKYPELLIKEIKIFKKKNEDTDSLFLDTEGNKIEGFEAISNLSSFAINSSLTFAAVALTSGEIILISGFPNLLDCADKEMKGFCLSRQNNISRNITNMKLTEIYENGQIKRILYVSTVDAIFCYEWPFDEKGNDDVEKSIETIFLTKNVFGVSTGCMDISNNFLILVSSSDQNIIEYKNLAEIKRFEWKIDGSIKNIHYFNDYIIFNTINETETSSSIQVYDTVNKFFALYKIDSKIALSLCADDKYIYAFIIKDKKKKYIVKLVEKENKNKFVTFFKKNFYETAASYAKYLGYDNEKISEIYKKHAEYEYKESNFDKSVDNYIKTINFLDPSDVIQRFLDKSKLEFLIKYLEGIQNNIDFKQRSLEKYKDYTSLLLNCYIMKEEIPKLKDFIDRKGDSLNPDIIKTVIDVCLDTQNVDLALDIAKKRNFSEEYLQILILRLNKMQEALDFMVPEIKRRYSRDKEDNSESKLTLQEQVNLLSKFGEYFINTDKKNKPISDLFFARVTNFIDKYNNELQKEDKSKLLQTFFVSDRYYKIVFEKLSTYGLEYDKSMIHRRIELYFEDGENGEDKFYRKKIVEMLKNDEFVGKYDVQYLMMLFKYKDFPEGIEVLSEITKQRQELLETYMEKKKYDKILNLCSSYGENDMSFWGLALNYFVDKDMRSKSNEKELKEINDSLEKLLEIILTKQSLLPANVLDIINEKNDELPLEILRKFIDSSINDELLPFEKKKATFDRYNEELNSVNKKITDLQTKASVFKINKCEVCFMGISLPAICFRCGHCYHSLCLYANVNDEMENIQCPKCEEEKKKLSDQIEIAKEFSEHINSKEALKRRIKESVDQFEFIHSLYGKGLMNLGPVDETRSVKDIKDVLASSED